MFEQYAYLNNFGEAMSHENLTKLIKEKQQQRQQQRQQQEQQLEPVKSVDIPVVKYVHIPSTNS